MTRSKQSDSSCDVNGDLTFLDNILDLGLLDSHLWRLGAARLASRLTGSNINLGSILRIRNQPQYHIAQFHEAYGRDTSLSVREDIFSTHPFYVSLALVPPIRFGQLATIGVRGWPFWLPEQVADEFRGWRRQYGRNTVEQI